jgi:uracil-DNA glycosylase
MASLDVLLTQVRGCTLCAAHLPLGPRPILQAHRAARILIVGQAPGRKAHAAGLPFSDISGDRLRAWLGVTRETFYNPRSIALLPMGFCYPGTGRSGDLPPRPECAPAWRAPLLGHLKEIRLTIVLGQYALAYHLPDETGTLADIVQRRVGCTHDVIPLPHPSPRNTLWLKRNPWVEADLLPRLRKRVARALLTSNARAGAR